MPPWYTAAQLDRIGQLLGTPRAVEVLETLAQHTDAVLLSHLPGPAATTQRAVTFLCEFGATELQGSGPDAAVSLTARGRRLAEAASSQHDG